MDSVEKLIDYGEKSDAVRVTRNDWQPIKFIITLEMSRNPYKMAFYIELIKNEKEDKNFVYYVYQFSITGEAYVNAKSKIRYKSKLVGGKLKLDKRNGRIDILELAENDNGMYVQRASSALVKHWKKGEFPEKTCWAS